MSTTPTRPDLDALRNRINRKPKGWSLDRDVEEMNAMIAYIERLENQVSCQMRFTDHIPSTNCAEWGCNLCGVSWTSPSKPPCERNPRKEPGSGTEGGATDD